MYLYKDNSCKLTYKNVCIYYENILSWILIFIKFSKCNFFMSRTNETRHIKWHEICKCNCRLDASVCNNK